MLLLFGCGVLSSVQGVSELACILDRKIVSSFFLGILSGLHTKFAKEEGEEARMEDGSETYYAMPQYLSSSFVAFPIS